MDHPGDGNAVIGGRCLILLMALMALPVGADNSPVAKAPRIAIIIDDVGHNLGRDRRALGLPVSVALAILPHAPHSQRLAERAHRIGHEVLLHMPMESASGESAEAAYLAAGMQQIEFNFTLLEALATVPHAVGVSNHQGSQLTGQQLPMSWLMTTLRRRGNLYFVDSRTSPDSVAYRVARAERVPALTRQIFLDHDREPAAIVAALERLAARARGEGQALAIGHPHPQTIDTLIWALPQLARKGIRLVPPSALLEPTRLAQAEAN